VREQLNRAIRPMEDTKAVPKTTRVFELAKEIGVSGKAILEHLKSISLPAKGAISVLTPEQVEKLLEYFTSGRAPAAAAGPAKEEKPAAAKPEKKKASTGPKVSPTPPPAIRPAEKVEKTAPPPPVTLSPSTPSASRPNAGHTGARGQEAEQGSERVEGPPPPPPAPPPPPPPPAAPVYNYTGPVSLAELARAAKINPSEIIKALLQEKLLITLNQRVGAEIVEKIGQKFNFTVTRKDAPGRAAPGRTAAPTGNLVPRAPVVTIMGHVDHGKTSLLDAIRSTDVAGGEAGGITQHIGAYKVALTGKGQVVFLDTPGHEAFTALRARGARVTDVVVLVVAGDDGVMPQTVEAIDHAKAAGVPIVVAINKMDKPEANPQRVKQELGEHGLQPEEWGGKTIMVEVSARKKTGLDRLLEMLLLEAELLELRADPESPAQGTVLEAKMHASRGPVATVLIQSGTLRVGDAVICGGATGRVRMMHDDHGHALREAGPSTPVELLGLSSVPDPGSLLHAAANEREARETAQQHMDTEREARLRRRHITLQDISTQAASGEAKELRIVIKADVQGSLEALTGFLGRLSNEKIRLTVIHGGVGRINGSDVALAAASDAVIIGFNVDTETQAEPLARQEGVEIRQYRIIFEATDDIRKAMEGMLAPKIEEVAAGRIEVRKTFRTPRGNVAGCFVVTGKALRGEKIKVYRGGQVVHEGILHSLRRIKDDVREVAAGYECGISTEDFNGWQAGDLIDMFTKQITQDKLSI